MRGRLVSLLLLSLLAILAACGDGGGGGERSATGLIVDLETVSLTKIGSFTLRTNEGETLEFLPAPDASQDQTIGLFPGHLRTHALLGDQVEVFYREEDGTLLALRIEDRQSAR